MNLFKRKNLYLIKKSPYGQINNNYAKGLIQEYDKEKSMPYETGKYLEALFNNSEDYVIGIHKTGFSYMDNKKVFQVFNDGLKNLGAIMQGMVSLANRNIENTVSFIDFFPLLIMQIKNANHYKTSTGVFVVKIPKSYLGQKEGEIKPIYFCDNGTIHLLPEFICGYIPVSENGAGDFIPNPNYTDFHTYKNDGLEYDISVENKIKEKPTNIVYF